MRQDLLKHIDRLIQQRPTAKAALAPFRELAALMTQSCPQRKPFPSQERLAEIKRQEGFPLFSRESLPLDFDSAAALLKEFLAHLSSTERDDREGLEKALMKLKTDPQWARKIFSAILRRDEKEQSRIAKDAGLEPKVLCFLGQVALRPSLNALRQSVSQSTGEKRWDYGYCPVCGSEPSMAYFTKSGGRHLHCELCGEEWPYRRLKCPFCQNDDQETLGYFQAEQEEGFRVYFCRKCLRYLKTVDTRVFEEPAPMDLEDLATMHLDILAGEHGFR